MTKEDKYKRLTAFRTSIKDVMSAEFKQVEDGADYLEYDKLKVSRVRVIGTIVAKRINEDKTYAYVVIDDGTETIRAKSWKEEVEKLEKPIIGDIIEMIGRVREWEGERYLTCESLNVINDANHWLYHKYELLLQGEKVERIEEKKETGMSTGVEAKKDKKENMEDEVLKLIKENDIGKGTSLTLINKKLKAKDKELEEVLKTLLNDGLIYEPSKHHYKILEV